MQITIDMKKAKQERVGRPSRKQPMGVLGIFTSNETAKKFREQAAHMQMTHGQYLTSLVEQA